MSCPHQRAAFHGEYEAADYVARKRLRCERGPMTRREQRQANFYSWYERDCLKQEPKELARPIKVQGEVQPSPLLPEEAEEQRQKAAAEMLARSIRRNSTLDTRTDREILHSRAKDGVRNVAAYRMMERKQHLKISDPGRPQLLHEVVAAKEALDLGKTTGGTSSPRRRRRRNSRPFNVVLQDEPGAYRGVVHTDAYSTMAAKLRSRTDAMGFKASELPLNRKCAFFQPERSAMAQRKLSGTMLTMRAATKFKMNLGRDSEQK